MSSGATRSIILRLRTLHKMRYAPPPGVRQVHATGSSSNAMSPASIPSYYQHDYALWTHRRLLSSMSSKPSTTSTTTTTTSTVSTTEKNNNSSSSSDSSRNDTSKNCMDDTTTTTPTIDTETITKQVDALMAERPNRATRYVYLRTLPLSEQAVFSTYNTTDLASIGEAIETRTRTILFSQLTKNHHNQQLLHIVPGSRTAVHVHTAALAVATWHVLHPGWIPDEQRVINMIRRAFGAPVLAEDGMSDEEKATLNDGVTVRPDYWVVRTALWFAWDKMTAVRKMTANMMSDFGSDFVMRVDDVTVAGLEQHILSVGKFYC